MTDQHPLTDDIIRYDKKLGCQDFGTWIYTENDLRAAADWQLQQVVEYLEKDLEFVLWSDSFMKNFKEAMRPTNTTTQEDNTRNPIRLDEGRVQRGGSGQGPRTPKPDITPKGQRTTND